MLKYAVATIIEATMGSSLGTQKTAHRWQPKYTPRQGMLYIRSRMISSRCNDNFDEFGADEIKKAYRSFVGKPVFVNHHNEDHRRARGVIIDAALHEDRNPDGSPDTWVEGLMEVDAIRFPKLAKAIVAGHIDRTSMGVDVAFSICSVCANKATTPLEYCAHIPGQKGTPYSRIDQKTGRRVSSPIREKCYGLRFFENSLLVEEPADPTAFMLGKVEMGPGLDHLRPHTASLDRRDRPLGYSETLSDDELRELAALRAATAASREWQEAFDREYLGLGEPGRRIAAPPQAAQSFHHVGGVHGVGAQDPINRVVAQRYVAPVAHEFSVRDRADQLLVTPSVRAHGTPSRIGQTEAAIPVFEHAAGPQPAGIRTTAGVHLGPPSFQLGESADHDGYFIRSGMNYEPMARTASLTMLAHGGTCPACWSEDTISMRGSAECFACEHHYPLQFAAAPRHADPATHPFFQANPAHADNVLRTWHQGTDDERESGHRWYPDAGLVAQGLGTLHHSQHPMGNTHLAAGLIANYSPQTGWAANQHNAARALHAGHGIGGPGSGIFASTQQKKAADRMIHGEAHTSVLTSPKVGDFAHLVEHGGDRDPDDPRTVVDRHALSVATGRRMTDADYTAFPKSNRHYYGHVVRAYADAAKVITDKTGKYTPAHAVQAATWLTQQRLNQHAEGLREESDPQKRLDLGRHRSRQKQEQGWADFRQQHLPHMDANPGTGYSATGSRRGRG